jgi:DNA-binding beta-propeller fold protein YncE
VDELIRDRIHEALEVEPPPAHLRVHVMASLPVANRGMARPALRRPGQWAAGLVAALLALTIIAGMLYSRGLLPFVPVRPQVAPPVGLISPEGVVVAPDGSVYVSDFLGDRVFKLRPSGTAVVVAGGGTGSDGLATKAWLNHPAGLAVDGENNLYVADASGGTIRKIDDHGIISTLVDAGGAFHVYGLNGVAVDGSGAVWVSEFYGTVRRIGADSRSSILDTSSLPPPAWVPGYMAFDAAGNLYISDRAPSASDNPIYQNPIGGGCRIVKVTRDHKVSVIAGTGVCGYSGDGGPAAKAQLNDPQGIAFDSAGNLYYADANNHRIRRIDANGIITTVAGTGVGGYGGDHGPANAAQLEYPYGMGMTSSGLLYFSDASCSCWNPTVPGRVRVLNLSTGIITTVMDGQTPISG